MAYVVAFILVLGSFSVMTKRYRVLFGVGVSVMLAFAGIRSYHFNSGGPDSWDLVILFVLLLCNIGLLARGAWMGIKPKQGKGGGSSG